MRWHGREHVEASAFPVEHGNGRLSLGSGQSDGTIQIASAFNAGEMPADWSLPVEPVPPESGSLGANADSLRFGNDTSGDEVPYSIGPAAGSVNGERSRLPPEALATPPNQVTLALQQPARRLPREVDIWPEIIDSCPIEVRGLGGPSEVRPVLDSSGDEGNRQIQQTNSTPCGTPGSSF